MKLKSSLRNVNNAGNFSEIFMHFFPVSHEMVKSPEYSRFLQPSHWMAKNPLLWHALVQLQFSNGLQVVVKKEGISLDRASWDEKSSHLTLLKISETNWHQSSSKNALLCTKSSSLFKYYCLQKKKPRQRIVGRWWLRTRLKCWLQFCFHSSWVSQSLFST